MRIDFLYRRKECILIIEGRIIIGVIWGGMVLVHLRFSKREGLEGLIKGVMILFCIRRAVQV
jgi:hypothetical protein